jgi:hypothetical protein
MEKVKGPNPVGVRRCQFKFVSGVKCNERFNYGPEYSVVALCPEHTAAVTPRNPEQYAEVVSEYGWR